MSRAGTCPIVITRTYTVRDAYSNSSTVIHTIRIDDNTNPAITGSIAATNVEGCNISAAPAPAATVAALEGMGLTISDACTADASLVVTSSDSNTGTCPIVITRTYRVTDACGNFSTATHTINIDDNTNPSITGSIAATNVEGCNISAAPVPAATVAALEGMGLTISDACTADASLVVTSSDSNTGTCPIVITRTYRVTDACGNFSTATHTINIDDNTNPAITGSIAATNVEGCNISAAPVPAATVAALEGMGLTISDACTADASLVVTSSDSNTGTCPIVITRTYRVTDACGNFSTATHTINIDDNTNPAITGSIAATNVEGCNISAAPAPAATVAALEGMGLMISDACTADASLVVTSSDSNTGTCPIVITRTYRVTDACGNFSTATHTINVDDNTRPTWTTAAGTLDRTVECSDAAALTAAQGLSPAATDNCDVTLTPVKTAGLFTAGTCPQAGTYTNTWTVSDDCGNAVLTVYTQTITVTDNTRPTWTTAAGTLDRTVECSDAAALTAAQGLSPAATDNCDVTLTPVKTAGSVYSRDMPAGRYLYKYLDSIR